MVTESAFLEGVTPALMGLIALIYLFLLGSGTLAALLLIRSALRQPIAWGRHSAELKARPFTWRDGGIVLLLVVLLLAIAFSVCTLLSHAAPGTLLLIQSLTLDVMGLIALAWYLHSRGLRWPVAFGSDRNRFSASLRLGFVFYLAILPFVFFSSMVYQGILSSNGYTPSLQDVALVLTGENPLWLQIYMLILAAVLAPVFEECLFRGILLPLLARRLGTGAAVLLSSVAFASIHFHLPSLVPLCVVAVGFSLGYLYAGSLWVPIVMHALFNGVNLSLLLLIR